MVQKIYPVLSADEDLPPSSPPPHATTADNLPFFELPNNAFTTTKSSSPPPLFSSDDSHETADIANYESPRIFKNKRQRTWFDNGDWTQTRVKKAKMTRNYDSGVYMMSDASSSSESLAVQHRSPFGRNGTSGAWAQTDFDAADTSLVEEEDEEERRFNSILHWKLEENSAVYDFGAMQLQDRHIKHIGKIASVIENLPDPGNELPAEGQYRSMVPRLVVNFPSNQLRHLTPSLFDATNITSLVLRDNKIQELPAAIGRLTNLRELHVSLNPLCWLPYELLKLWGSSGHLDIFGGGGVHWLQPKTPQSFYSYQIARILTDLDKNPSNPEVPREAQVQQHIDRLHKFTDAQPNREELPWHMRIVELWSERNNTRAFNRFEMLIRSVHGSLLNDDFAWNPLEMATSPRGDPQYLARTPVSYFDCTSALVEGSPVPPTSCKDAFDIITETKRGAHGVPATFFTPPQEEIKHTNSLATMSLHAALRHKDTENLSIADVRDRIGEPSVPAADALLAQAERNDVEGFGAFRQCHTCQREYVVARAEWIEWWMVSMSVVYPFKVRVCSWACVPEEKRARPEKELEWR